MNSGDLMGSLLLYCHATAMLLSLYCYTVVTRHSKASWKESITDCRFQISTLLSGD